VKRTNRQTLSLTAWRSAASLISSRLSLSKKPVYKVELVCCNISIDSNPDNTNSSTPSTLTNIWGTTSSVVFSHLFYIRPQIRKSLRCNDRKRSNLDCEMESILSPRPLPPRAPAGLRVILTLETLLQVGLSFHIGGRSVTRILFISA
jgi:hypothetical protein